MGRSKGEFERKDHTEGGSWSCNTATKPRLRHRREKKEREEQTDENIFTSMSINVVLSSPLLLLQCFKLQNRPMQPGSLVGVRRWYINKSRLWFCNCSDHTDFFLTHIHTLICMQKESSHKHRNSWTKLQFVSLTWPRSTSLAKLQFLCSAFFCLFNWKENSHKWRLSGPVTMGCSVD